MKHTKLLLLLIGLLFSGAIVSAQEDELHLSLRRDFGYGFGSDIEGTFSMRVTGPDTLTRVSFLIDDEVIAEDTEAPFRFQFNTNSYDTGTHTMRATGFTSDGRELNSNAITQNFVTRSTSNSRLIYLVIPLLILVIGGRLLSNYIANRGQPKRSGRISIDGAYGGTICAKCRRPYARHWWAPNLVTGKFDRCPHCGHWGFATRYPHDVLEAAAEATEQVDAAEASSKPSTSSEDWRQKLDDSRFDQ